ncbi:MAG TPA: hypothetical protein EYO73_11350, partial [Sulfurimonas sp.]|nr:hypothetical protein [Sulfurimonas sp.]
MVALVPCLLILGWRFLYLHRVVMGLGVLFLFKLILFMGAPSSGLGVKVYTNPSNYENRELTRTYASLWNEEISGLLVRPWTQKFDFPIDWFLPLGLSPINELSLIEGTLEEKFRHMKLWLTVDGAALLPEGTGLALVVSGVVDGKLVANNSQGQSLNILLVSSFEEASKRFGELPVGGDWEISGNLHYYGENWTLIPVLVEKGGNVAPAFEKGVLWQNPSVIEKSSSSLTFYRITAKVFDYGLCAFLFAWMVWCLRQLVQSKVLTLPLACFSMAGVGLIWVFEPILDRIHPDPAHLAHLGLATTAAGGGLLLWWIWKKQLSTV